MSHYDTDYYRWTQEQAQALREGRLEPAEAAHLAEEIEDLGKQEYHCLESRLEVLLVHLLKWNHLARRRNS